MDLKKNDMNFKKSSARVITLNGAKIGGIGKATLDLSGDEITFKSTESTYTLNKSVSDIDFLIYAKGNFFIDDKIHMGINGEQFKITCTNDELGLRNFYDNLVQTKKFHKHDKVLKDSTTKTMDKKQEEKAQASVPEETAETSASEEIRNFYNLMKDGIITEEEFEEKKKELLKSK